ncbi:MAG: hypothetical protein QXF12_03405 [Candidatus Aenigmatarchaeota archaeon]
MKYLVVSDIHLGHNKTKTEHIIKNLKKHVFNDSNKDVDVIFIAGDLFDRLLDLNEEDVILIMDFLKYMLAYCSLNDILLRVLEGTPSHDWFQPRIILNINNMLSKKADLKYIRTIDIEYIERIKKYVLYIPDEWSNDHNELENQIKELLVKNSITNVDIAILHGQFKYQILNKKYKGFYFKEEYFLNLVKGYIHVGHYHTHSSFDRIIAQGSFDRLSHGEEEPKGYVKVIDDKWYFIENPDSYKYVTIDLDKIKSIDELDKKIRKLPKNSYIRFKTSSKTKYDINELKIRYIDYNISKKDINETITQTEYKNYMLDLDSIDLNIKNYISPNDILKELKDHFLTNDKDQDDIKIYEKYINKYKDFIKDETEENTYMNYDKSHEEIKDE